MQGMQDLAAWLQATVWGRALTPVQLARVIAQTHERQVPCGCCVARMGEPASHWLGIIDGLGKMSVLARDGRITSLTGAAAGAWFGEGSLLKAEPFRYDVVALRDTRVALLPQATFHWLRTVSLPFNHYLQHLLNARLGLFIGLLEVDRLLCPEARVARCIASLFDPELYPVSHGADASAAPRCIPLAQHEVALLAGVSRQRANLALQRLCAAGLIEIERGRLTVRDLAGLQGFVAPG